MKKLLEFITFRYLMTPLLLQILFWAAIGGVLYGSWWLYTHDNWAWVMSLVFGTLVTRVIFESLMLRFKTYQTLVEIRDNLVK